MIKLMAKETIFMLMELSIREIGRMINSMGLESRHGLMEQYMRETIMRAKKTDKGN